MQGSSAAGRAVQAGVLWIVSVSLLFDLKAVSKLRQASDQNMYIVADPQRRYLKFIGNDFLRKVCRTTDIY